MKEKKKIEGILEDAQKLGVCRTHLYRVLTGKRKSARLLKRYQDLQSNRSAKYLTTHQENLK